MSDIEAKLIGVFRLSQATETCCKSYTHAFNRNRLAFLPKSVSALGGLKGTQNEVEGGPARQIDAGGAAGPSSGVGQN
jgi:hypothetical protein